MDSVFRLVASQPERHGAQPGQLLARGDCNVRARLVVDTTVSESAPAALLPVDYRLDRSRSPQVTRRWARTQSSGLLRRERGWSRSA